MPTFLRGGARSQSQPNHPSELETFVAEAASRKASVVAGGKRAQAGGRGRFFEATLVRDVDPTLGSVSRWNRVYESLAVRTGMTKAPSSRPHYRAAEEWKREMERVGFTCEIEPPANRFFADVVIRGTKR